MSDETETENAETEAETIPMLKAEIGRFDSTYKVVRFRQGDKVKELLDKADISISSGEEINDDGGEEVKPEDVAKDNETYHITGNYKNGQQ